MCGTPVEATTPTPTPDAAQAEPVEERRIVTILFADLVGFTERSDRADPEDVRRTLRAFHARAKQEIERFGGIVDKFIGDAVMGVFGAPVAHGDDPERAVRAALRIVERIAEVHAHDPAIALEVRVAVNTGEAVVAFGHGPQVGEAVAGDVVNTASRLQSIASTGSVVVGEATHRATRDLIAYQSLGEVEVKGKAEPLQVWRAVGPIGPPGLEPGSVAPAVPLVGRTEELALLDELFAMSVHGPSTRLVTIVGEPGIGKTRLVQAFRAGLGAASEAGAPTWLAGRCLAYGEAVTYWPLAEVVKAEAGIREDDDRAEARRKLAAALAALDLDQTDRDWLEVRLAPLVGVETSAPGEARAAREELFEACARFVWAIAGRGPLVLAFEDLHWADPSMLDLVEHLADRVVGVPLLIVGSARTELFERRPTWGGGHTNSTTIALSRLSATETTQLLAGLLLARELSEERRAALMEGVGGNPLFAVEFVRMLEDARAQPATATTEVRSDIAVPLTIQSLIAARLDGLPAWERSLTQDASVVGQTFWSGAVAAMAGLESRHVDEGLDDLTVRELIERTPSSSMAGEDEFVFSHGLVREVAYRQIPRGSRARRHRLAAEWIESRIGDRAADRAELLAHHYLQAVELGRASGATDEEEDREAERRARRYLGLAADRALALDTAAAVRLLDQALAITPPGHPDRPVILARAVTAGRRTAAMSIEEAEAALNEAVDGFLARGDRVRAGEAMVRLSQQLGFQGQSERAKAALAEALELLEAEPPGRELALAYATRAEDEMLGGHVEESLTWSQQALDLVERDDREAIVTMCLHLRGNARLELGDPDGMEDLRTALDRSFREESGSGPMVSLFYLGEWRWALEGPGAGLEEHERGIELAARRGLVRFEEWGKAESLWMLFDAGRWDDLLARAAEVMRWDAAAGESQAGLIALTYAARVRVHRGDVDAAAGDLDELLSRARDILDELQVAAPALVAAVEILHARGQLDRAMDVVEELRAATEGVGVDYRLAHLPSLSRACVAGGRADLARSMLMPDTTAAVRQRWCRTAAEAILVEADGDLERAAALYTDAAAGMAGFGFVLEEGHAWLGVARVLGRLGRDSAAPFDRARAAFDRLGASSLAAPAEDAAADSGSHR